MNRHPRDEGVALLMALMFLLLFALAVPALLGFGFSSLGYATAVEDRGRVAYAGDGAVEATIANLRNNPTLGVEGGPSCDATIDLNGSPILVRCAPRTGSGAVTTTGGSGADPANTPAQAIFIAGTDAGEIGLEKASNSNIRVGGSIVSRNTVTVQTSSVLEVTGDVRARISCDAVRIAATGSTTCPAADATIPSWAPELTALPARRAVPACTGAIVTLVPGWYDDAAALNGLTNGACTGRTIHFAPGAYYFEFTGAGREWSLTDPNTEVVGGTLLLPAANDCVRDAPAGVQWIFGGDSRIRVQNGKLNLCATPHVARQRIAVYGLTQSVGGQPSTTGPATTSSSQVSAGWTNVPATAGANGSAVAGDGRHVEIVRTSAQTGAITQTFASTTLPAGAVIEQALIRVVHQEDPVNRTAPPSLTIAGNPTPYTIPESATQWTTHDVDATAWFAAEPARLTAPVVTYSVTGSHASHAGTFRLDGTSLIVTYRVPGMTGSSGCLLQRFGTGCALITTVGNPTRLLVRGTIYAPAAPLDLLATNQSEQVADRGIVARAMRLAVTASAPVGYEMVSIPTSGSPPVTVTADRAVVLTACPQNPATGGCRKRGDGTDDVVVTATVRFRDATASGRAEIERWLVN